MSFSTLSQVPTVTLRRDLLASGLDDRAIARLVRSGQLRRIRRGAYVDVTEWNDASRQHRYAALCRAVQLQAKSDLVLSHVSALPAYDGPLWGVDLSVVHGTRRDGRVGRRDAGVRQHGGLLLPEDVDSVDGSAVTSATRTCLDVSSILPLRFALPVVNDFLHRGLTTTERLRARYESAERGTVLRAHSIEVAASMVNWPGTLTMDVLLRLAHPGCESVGESRVWYLCWHYGLPMPEVQYEVRDQAGHVVARLDFAWPDRGVFLEFDGQIKYARPYDPDEDAVSVVLREKRREDLVRELTGWRCLRVTWADLGDEKRTVQRIRAALVAAEASG